MAKSTSEAKAASTKVTSTKLRKARGEGAQVSLSVDAKVWKVLHAVSRLRSTKINVVLASGLQAVLDANGVTVEQVQRYLAGPSEPAPQKIESPVLSQLFAEHS